MKYILLLTEAVVILIMIMITAKKANLKMEKKRLSLITAGGAGEQSLSIKGNAFIGQHERSQTRSILRGWTRQDRTKAPETYIM